MKKFMLLVLAVLLIILTACSSTSKRDSELTNKEKVVALLKSLETRDKEPLAYINPNMYFQHNLSAADGLDGFKGFLDYIKDEDLKVNTIRVFEDGDYVFAHSSYQYKTLGNEVGFDIFRFEDGMIVEHWDNLTPKAEPNPSGRTQLDGATEITDLDKTEENKEIVKNFIIDVLMGAKPSNITKYISTEKYIQHNSEAGDGLEGLGRLMEEMAKAGIVMKYDTTWKLLGEGNFVLSVSEGKLGDKHVSYYDLFRLEDGMIVEHWDVIEEIPPREEWANPNGKF